MLLALVIFRISTMMTFLMVLTVQEVEKEVQVVKIKVDIRPVQIKSS